MNETLMILFAWAAGGGLGAMFFGGLWWTVRKGMASEQPALLFFCSLAVRMSLALAGFYFVSEDHWQRLLACLLGFIMARALMIRLTRPAPVMGGRACA
ncbi:MAG: ATP synthase subunit I [Elusimicrobia bacterium CG11_big_fil_rev_8_21_14_0_20_64_6]|nr:MAG: ATP synthase subunit I [Elusimicrobia bacterium CG11_big_fil_rev_8_21_14_0_20_64_6]